MNVYRMVADRLTKEERYALWVEANENPRFSHLLATELNREVPLESVLVDDSQLVLNFLPGTVVAVDENGPQLLKTEQAGAAAQPTLPDRGTIVERMRTGGVTYGELFDVMFQDGAALAATLNGLYFLDIGHVQPYMGEDETLAVWDGSFVWDADRTVMEYEGADGPSGGRRGYTRKITLAPETLVELF